MPSTRYTATQSAAAVMSSRIRNRMRCAGLVWYPCSACSNVADGAVERAEQRFRIDGFGEVFGRAEIEQLLHLVAVGDAAQNDHRHVRRADRRLEVLQHGEARAARHLHV